MAEQAAATTDTRPPGDGHRAHLRERSRGAGAVRPIELFFDLVYVLAVTQLTRHLPI
jgi:low temperature requirement protein LtrA